MSMTPSPWAQFPAPALPLHHSHLLPHHLHQMPGIPINVPLPLPPPILTPPNSNLLASPLPTALFPLTFDQSCPPAVLPTFNNGSQSSGYSTAGHSRSSSPMQGPGPGPAPATTTATGTSQTVQPGLLGNSPADSSTHSGSTTSPHLSPNNAGGSSSSSSSSIASTSGNHQHHHQHHTPSCPFGGLPSPNLVFEAPSAEISILSHFPTLPGQFVVYFHINPGVNVSFQVENTVQVIKGPMTVPLVSTNSNPPIPLPMQVPPGHVVQQIVDESGTLRHVIVSHQPPLMPIPAYGPGNQNQPFYSGPYPGAPFGPMQGVPCGMHSNQGPTPPPGGPNSMAGGSYMSHIPSHAHKDDRSQVQRQFVKYAKRKYEPKREATTYQNHYHQNGAYNGRKDGGYNNNNNSRRNVPNGTSKTVNGGVEEEGGSVGSTGSVTSTGTQDEEDDSRIQAQTEMLSAIIPPCVSDVTCRSAFIKWSSPDRFTEAGENKYPEFDVSDTDFRYEVFISDRSRPENRFKSIFCGTALSCRVKDLKPGTVYAISYCSMLNDVKGNTSTATAFTTLPSEPDPPASPRATTRSRNSLAFKWNPPNNDNGSKVTSYILEFDEGKGGSHFVEAYRGKNKQCTVSKLQPAFSYQFRLAAINEVGQSRFSPTTTVMTAGSPPAQPQPPTLTEAGVTYLTLEWKSRPTDDEYTLQMENPHSGHGFLCVYNGSAPHYTCIGLTRNTQYKYRVKAYNAEGHSKWSDEVVLSTLPERPGPPHKPQLKGKVHSSNFKVRWEPGDTGGVPITHYALEIEQGNGRFEEIYRGPETEYNVDKLSPGQSYPLRVIAFGPGGQSDPSEPCVITTEPVAPGKCNIPRTIGKPKSNSVHLKWSAPDWDGGSPVNLYEVGCTTPDNQTQEAYRGKETSCFVNGLLPGRSYLFQIRSYNRIGAGPWSDPLEIISGAGSPDTPSTPKVSNKTSHSVVVSWAEPLNNGSAITEYRVQMATPYFPSPPPTEVPSTLSSRSATPPEERPEDVVPTDKDLSTTPVDEPVPEDVIQTEMTMSASSIATSTPESQTTSFSQVYLGSASFCEVKGLQPASIYLFRVQATNCAGCSDWSPVTTHQMSASSPNAVTQVEGVATSSSITLTWATPQSNGSSILHYNLMLGETTITAPSNAYTLDNLMPDTHYKIRVQAVNSVGPGPFSSILKISTKPLPPQPPKLELVSTAHFWMKLKWSAETSLKNIEYIVQMINPYQDEFQVAYRGTLPTCKVTRLAENTEYQFRICGLNAAGQGPFSEMYRFSTLKAPPPPVKGLKVTQLKDLQIRRFEWAEVATPNVVYQLQISKRKEQEFKVVHRGEGRRYDMKDEELEAGVEYMCRVCAVRQSEDENHLVGPYSNVINFLNPLPPSELVPPPKSVSASSFKSNISTTAQVLEEKMNSISYESKVGIMAVIALIILAFVISLITHHVVS